MENENKEDSSVDHYLQPLLNSFSKVKDDYSTYKEQHLKIKLHNARLMQEICELKETEKLNQHSILSSREIISNLQESVSNLVHLKKEIKKLNTDMKQKDKYIEMVQQDQEKLIKLHQEEINDLKLEQNQIIKEIMCSSESKIQSLQKETDTKIAQSTCQINELNAKITELEMVHKEKINLLVMDYEERIQRAAAQVTQLRDQHTGLVARTDANIDVYKRKIDELEEKLKQGEFKKYLASSNLQSQGRSQYDFASPCTEDSQNIEPHYEAPRAKVAPTVSQVKLPNRATNQLQVMYYDNKAPTAKSQDNKKGPFNITRKRKLYTDKDFM